MPRAIAVGAGTAGIASYNLTVHETWTLTAVTFTVNMDNATSDDAVFMDFRDDANGLINRQYCGFVHFTTGFSLAPESEPWNATDGSGTDSWPQNATGNLVFVTQRMSPVTLYDGCTVSVYASLGQPTAGVDPSTTIDPGVVIPDLHLWVEDAVRVEYTPPKPLLPILVHAPEYV